MKKDKLVQLRILEAGRSQNTMPCQLCLVSGAGRALAHSSHRGAAGCGLPLFTNPLMLLGGPQPSNQCQLSAQVTTYQGHSHRTLRIYSNHSKTTPTLHHATGDNHSGGTAIKTNGGARAGTWVFDANSVPATPWRSLPV